MSGSPGRQQFLADIIAELSRQKLEDAAAFEGVQKTPASALFRKLCFDFPSITDAELDQVYTAMRGLFVTSPDSSVDADFKRTFYFDEKFMENIGYLCNTDTTAAVTTESKSNGQGIYKIAILQFLASPTYMLNCPSTELSRILSCDGEPQGSWKFALQRFHHIVHLSAVSTIASHAHSSGTSVVLPVLQEGVLIATLCQAIDQLGRWVDRAERQLSRRTEDNSDSSQETGDTTSRAAVALEMLDSLGAVGDRAGRFSGAQSLTRLLEEVLVAADAAGEGADSRRSLGTLDAVLRVLKPCWLHLTLFLRDVLVQYPQLLPAQAGALLGVLDQRDSTSQRVVIDFGRKSSAFPSAVECMFVVVLSSLCASVRADTGASSSVAHTVACLHGKNALRAYLEAPSTLPHFVDVCARMTADSTVGKSVKSVNIESVGFLIDTAVPFTCDPTRLTVNAPPRPAASAVAPTSVLISSGLLPALLFNFLTLLEQQAVPGRPQPSQQTTLLVDRLVQSLALLVLPASSPSTSGTAVLRYVLDFPDLLPRLLALSESWQPAAIGSGEAFAPMPVFSEAQVLGLVSALLLGQLNSHVHPGGAALVVSAGTQEALLTAVTRGCTAVKGALRQLVCLYRDQPSVVVAPAPVAPEATPPVANGGDLNDPTEGNGSTSNEPSSIPPPPTEADAAVLRAKKLRASQLSAALQYLASLAHSLHLLTGEGACAPILRALCLATGWKNANSTSTMCVIVQAVLVGFVNDAVVAVNEGLQLLRGREVVPDSDDKTGKASAIGKGSASAAGHLEDIKKLLKALQGLLSGGTSSKSD